MGAPIDTRSLRPLRSGRRGGFALLLTLILVAFVVVLLVGLATYTKIETAIAGNMQQQAQARQNALLALDVALGQLQKYAGPDTRITAVGEVVPGVVPQKTRYTGVWHSDPAAITDPSGIADRTKPLAWLVSGLEAGATQDVTTAVPTANRVELVGAKTASAAADRVTVTLQELRTFGVPGQTAAQTALIGRYGWWVGDNGVKADVTRPDVTGQLDYAPFVYAGEGLSEMRGRLWQQTGLGAGPLVGDTAPFDSRSSANLSLAANVLTPQQIAFLRTGTGTATVGPTVLAQNYGKWTAGNFAVLANTNPLTPGLRVDLSRNTSLLGAAFAAWENYTTYMEDPVANPLNAALEAPLLPANALRRRYRMQPPVVADGASFSVAPVLSYFALALGFRNNAGATDLEVSVSGIAGLWNPYSSALVPEDLQLVVTGLPEVEVRDAKGGSVLVDVLKTVGETDPVTDTKFLTLHLPWPAVTTDDDRASWLPGRVYNWSTASSAVATPPPSGWLGHSMIFGEKNLSAASGVVGLARPPLTASGSPASGSAPVTRHCVVKKTTQLTIELRRASDGTKLATFVSPEFLAFPASNPTKVEDQVFDFAFIFRLADPVVDGAAAWLQTTGADPRLSVAPASQYAYVGNSFDPAQIVLDTSGATAVNQATLETNNPGILLDRFPGTSSAAAGMDFTEDVPVFELPRAPLVSLGLLQHLSLPAARPFWVGNSIASTGAAPWNNALFDQYFFSGLGSGSGWADIERPLPNPLLHVVRNTPAGGRIAPDDIITGSSARYLLQGGAFNLNSVDVDAWSAVLKSVRFPAGREFKYLDADPALGTAAETVAQVATPAIDAAFPRFSQSAQETFKVTSSYAQSQPSTFTTPAVVLPTESYRQGMRTLTNAEVRLLATEITNAIKLRHAAGGLGPFRTVEEFLGPATGVAGTPSVIEEAIEKADLNLLDPANPAAGNRPFSSSFLTQADIMTVLAPLLFVRSDTFTIRTYGEVVNPATGATEGRAWCEAIVQRFPEPIDPAIRQQPTDAEYQTPPGDLGRRFKVVSFRWLTRSDI